MQNHMRVARALCLSLLALPVASLGADISVAPNGRTFTAARLPQDHAYQVALRNYLGTLKEEHLHLEKTVFAPVDPPAAIDPDTLFRNSLARNGKGSGLDSLRAPAKLFTLAEIEKDGKVRCFFRPEVAAWWVHCDLPGNPFHAYRPAKLRAFVMAAVNMMLVDAYWHSDECFRRADGLSGNVFAWTAGYLASRDVLPEAARQAFETGLWRVAEAMLRAAPQDVNGNMDTKELIVLANLDKIFAGDRARHKRIIREARRILFGRPGRGPADSDGVMGLFHSAGYIGEKDGPETTYNGIALFHLVEAALITRGRRDWDAFMPEVIGRMLKFQGHCTFPEPDGNVVGPSNWAKRTNQRYAHQRTRSFRLHASAMLSDWGLFVSPELPPVEELAKLVARQRARFAKPPAAASKGPPGKFGFYWPADLNYAYEYYVKGHYARMRRLQQEKSPLLLHPFLRQGDVNERFDAEFWSVKRGAWGFLVESVASMGLGYDMSKGERVGALAGGSLSAFWTKDTGSVILSMLPSKWSAVFWKDVDVWPTHHLWGRDEAGKAFSSARNWRTYPHYDDDENPKSVFLRGTIGSMDSWRSCEPGCTVDMVNYSRLFEKTATGIRVSSEFRTPHQPTTVSELWETIPVFLRDGRAQKKLEDAKVEVRSGGEWMVLPALELEEAKKGSSRRSAVGKDYGKTDRIRVTRFGKSVDIELDRARVLRDGGVLQCGYQSGNRIRVLHIDLIGSGGKAIEMPRCVKNRFAVVAE